MTIVNTGMRAWDPARVHVSYHWLWLLPRETIKRSRWDLPYHDGIRSELSGRAESIAPGARVALPAGGQAGDQMLAVGRGEAAHEDQII